MAKNDFVFVLSKNSIDGIVTKADINKPIIRIYLFGIISLFELHINFWISHYYPENSWGEQLRVERIDIANELYAERRGNNLELTLLECLQICDKRDILKKTKAFREDFRYSSTSFRQLLRYVEIIRNEIAHSQSSIIDNLEWDDFVSTVFQMMKFLQQSEERIIH